MRITEELLRKRSEHNDGVLADLEEIALHQFEIEKIEGVGIFCRRLKILLLQNNIIGRLLTAKTTTCCLSSRPSAMLPSTRVSPVTPSRRKNRESGEAQGFGILELGPQQRHTNRES